MSQRQQSNLLASWQQGTALTEKISQELRYVAISPRFPPKTAERLSFTYSKEVFFAETRGVLVHLKHETTTSGKLAVFPLWRNILPFSKCCFVFCFPLH